MREWRKKVKRILVLLLTAALIGNTVDFPVFAVSAAKNRETGLCRHHQSHTVECGYSEEDNMPCEYECCICPMEDLIAALPDEVTEANVPLEVTSMPQKAKNSEGTMLEVGSDFIYEIDGTTYNCIVVSSTSNEAASSTPCRRTIPSWCRCSASAQCWQSRPNSSPPSSWASR